MTLYEIDAKGWVHRQVQLHSDGSRFSPEDILMCHPVVTAAMANHPAADEIGVEEFEHMWKEVAADRPFCARIPDPTSPWAGQMSSGDRVFDVAWAPDTAPAAGWECVPGFVNLFVRCKPEDARSACAAVFVEDAIDWYALTKAA